MDLVSCKSDFILNGGADVEFVSSRVGRCGESGVRRARNADSIFVVVGISVGTESHESHGIRNPKNNLGHGRYGHVRVSQRRVWCVLGRSARFDGWGALDDG